MQQFPPSADLLRTREKTMRFISCAAGMITITFLRIDPVHVRIAELSDRSAALSGGEQSMVDEGL